MPELLECHRMASYLRFNTPFNQPIVKMGYNVRHYFEGQSWSKVNDFFEGNLFERVSRKGKYIIFHTPRGIFLSHQRFTGWWENPSRPDHLNYMEFGKPPGVKEVKLAFGFLFGSQLRFHDSRTLANLRFYWGTHDASAIDLLKSQGPDVLSLDTMDTAFSVPTYDFDWFRSCWEQVKAKSSKQELKLWLLEQKFHSGVGNILACEALWHAQLNPLMSVLMLNEEQQLFLYGSVLKAANEALHNNVDYPKYIHVFRQKTCGRCGGEIQRIEQANRGTYWCPICQA